MTRRRLPTGLQTFRELREENCYYVDKTGFIARLVEKGKHYFLSRPRRFGKSLFLDTLKELFEGSEALFAGLHSTTGGTSRCAIRWCGSTSEPGTSASRALGYEVAVEESSSRGRLDMAVRATGGSICSSSRWRSRRARARPWRS